MQRNGRPALFPATLSLSPYIRIYTSKYIYTCVPISPLNSVVMYCMIKTRQRRTNTDRPTRAARAGRTSGRTRRRSMVGGSRTPRISRPSRKRCVVPPAACAVCCTLYVWAWACGGGGIWAYGQHLACGGRRKSANQGWLRPTRFRSEFWSTLLARIKYGRQQHRTATYPMFFLFGGRLSVFLCRRLCLHKLCLFRRHVPE